MNEWIKFDGGYEQINEMLNAPHGWKIKYKCGVESDVSFTKPADDDIQAKLIESYLILEPQPHAEMIIEWARTSRPVYHKASDGEWYLDQNPHWYEHEEYSFDPPRNTLKYRVALLKNKDGFYTYTVDHDHHISEVQSHPNFISWIDEEWQEVEV